ncbi:V-set domain-containing T-cell activation inhibitor 1-like isoform X1 [Coregonus clupeaformis]|uniref:V-set domain-containing T-cell activation inhibitor 1-like isoform X1 n=1 Tax=Coregonus clupeaformis TaxID=59861 RepID=UPI001BE11FF0|nr:V-set domain-containing T-cell activation inhibitor 1-like isoform X1 [Coregonus clupeaformis]
MASLGQIIFWGMIVMIFVAAGLIILILSVSFAGQSFRGSQGTVDSNNKWPIGNLGEDVILSCKFKTSTKSGELTSQVSITWKKGLSEVVYNYDKGAVQLTDQNPQFKDRTQLFSDAIGGGNASLLLRNVKVKDEGVYYCSVNAPSGSGTASVNLRAAAFSAPKLKSVNTTLTAEAERWFPKPNVIWLDVNDNVLNESETSFFNNSAGITRFISSLQQITLYDSYTCIIQNHLVKAVSQATVKDTEISAMTFFSFPTAAAPPILQPQWHFQAATASVFLWIYQLT